MAKGISLHIGLNYVDPNHYAGWDGKLNACEFDASDMERIASSKGFQTKRLIRSEATRQNVISSIEEAINILNSGDLLFISYSGHGGQTPDFNDDEDDGIDETWCLFDGQLLDDELFLMWSGFKRGVRILVISDSCHSGTVIKVAKGDAHVYSEYSPKFMNHEVASTTFLHNKRFYEDLASKASRKVNKIEASVKLISGCQDNQYSYDGPFNGQFTGSLKRIWNGGSFKGSYKNFHKKISQLLPSHQTPNYLNIGVIDESFNNQSPFKI